MHSAVLGVPLLVLDTYEHSYHMDFAAGRYVDAFLANVQWDEVSRRAEWAQKARRARHPAANAEGAALTASDRSPILA